MKFSDLSCIAKTALDNPRSVIEKINAPLKLLVMTLHER